MEYLVDQAARFTVLIVQAVAIVVIALGVLEVLIRVVQTVLLRRMSRFEFRQIWLDFARWLVAGLTLQLAADIVQTTVAPTWDEIGRVAAIAVTRTFLSYFLDRDMDVISARQAHSVRGSDGP